VQVPHKTVKISTFLKCFVYIKLKEIQKEIYRIKNNNV